MNRPPRRCALLLLDLLAVPAALAQAPRGGALLQPIHPLDDVSDNPLQAAHAALEGLDVRRALSLLLGALPGYAERLAEQPAALAELHHLTAMLAVLADDAVQAEGQTDRALALLARLPSPDVRLLRRVAETRQQVAVRLGRADAIERLVRRVARPEAQPAGLAAVALMLAQTGPYAAVEPLATALLDRLDAEPAHLRRAHRARGEARRQLGDLAGADQDLATAAHEAPADERVAARLSRARVALDRRDFAAAQRLVGAASQEARTLGDGGLDAEVERVAGGIARLRGDLPGARAAYDRAAARDPEPAGRARALVAAAELARRLGDHDGAIARAQAATEAAEPLSLVPLELIGQAFLVIGLTAADLSRPGDPARADLLARSWTAAAQVDGAQRGLDDPRRAEPRLPLPPIAVPPHRAAAPTDGAPTDGARAPARDGARPSTGDADPVAAAARYAEARDLAVATLGQAVMAFEMAYDAADDPRLAPARAHLADARDRNGDAAGADAALADALLLAQLAPLQAEAWVVHAAAGRIAQRRGLPGLAVLHLKEAVDALQGLRRKVSALGDAADTPFQSGYREHYVALADALIEAGRLPEAQEALDLLKRSEYRGFTRDAGLTRDATGRTVAERDLAARTKAAAEPVLALAQRYGALLARKRAAEQVAVKLTAAEETELANLRDALTGARAQWLQARQTLLSEAAAAEADHARQRASSPGALAEALAHDGALQGTLARLGPGAVLVHTLITADRLHLLVTAPHARLARSVAVPAATLHREIHALRQALMAPGSAVEIPAAALYQRLIAPIRADLVAGGAQTLHFALDGALRYIPLAALYDAQAERYLVEDFALVLHTAAARHQLDRAPAQRLSAAGLGVRHGGAGFGPLPGAGAELEAIVRRDDTDADGVLPGIIRLDADFTRAALTDALEGGFSVVHVASHFAFRPGTDADSFLLLGDGQRLSLADLRVGPYPFDAVDLLTLSACDTALGSGDGREVDGFGALAQAQGARAVIATLWPVADRSTSTLMAALYTRLAARQDAPAPAALGAAQVAAGSRPAPPAAGAPPAGAPPADAPRPHLAQSLAAVQRAFLRGEIGAEERHAGATRRITLDHGEAATTAARGATGPTGWRHPYHWAPFILMGDGR